MRSLQGNSKTVVGEIRPRFRAKFGILKLSSWCKAVEVFFFPKGCSSGPGQTFVGGFLIVRTLQELYLTDGGGVSPISLLLQLILRIVDSIKDILTIFTLKSEHFSNSIAAVKVLFQTFENFFLKF